MNLFKYKYKAPTVSLCISTYNWPTALKLCLDSILQQKIMPIEILIGDDGSTDETKKIIDDYKAKFAIPVIHIWQADEGFRLATIRNKCFLQAAGDYIIQIDGDLILHKNFVKDHITFSKKKTFLCGTRALINAETSKALEQSGEISWKNIKENLGKKKNAYSIKLITYIIYFFKRGINQTKFVLGANMSFWREDLFLVNGYNEDFTGWGKEDNDIAIRLFNASVEIRFLKSAGIVYHLFHKEASKANLAENEHKMKQTIINKITFISNGIIKKI